MLRNHCFAECFSKSVTFSSLLTLCTRHLCDLISSCTHNYTTSMCFSFPIPCLWRVLSVAFASMFSAGSLQNLSHASCFDSLCFRRSQCCCIQFCLCFRVYAFMVCPPSIRTPALDDFRVSLQPAQSEVREYCQFLGLFAYSNTCSRCLSCFRYLASLFNLARLCWLGLDIFWHNSFKIKVMSALS